MPLKQDPGRSGQSRPSPADSGKKKSSGTGRGRKSQSGRRKASFLAVLVELARMTFFGRVFLVLLLAGVLCLLNILLSRNQFDLFFQLTGVELLVTAIIVWLRLILRRRV
jgi:hypothetical protein